MPRFVVSRRLILVLCLACWVGGGLCTSAVPTFVPWHNTRLRGNPEPLPPFRAVRAYPNLKPQGPIAVKREPGANRILFLENRGYDELRGFLKAFAAVPDASTSEKLLELQEHVYSLTFHPDYERNGQLYLGVNGPGTNGMKHTRIVRYTIDRGPAHNVVPGSRRVIIEWPSNGHNGGDCAFGPDGMLYVTAGDGTSSLDADNVGQDLSTLRAKVLRIDVDGVSSDQSYRVPPDNPFLGHPEARPETWAYGLRNPWRITSDPVSGQIWVGENGQDLREYAHLLGKGENYGWSAYEGSRPLYVKRLNDAAPFTPPTIEHDHGAFRSLTGGVVYRGRSHPELSGAYVYGDYSTGRIGAMLHDGRKVVWQRELADTPLAIVGFGTDLDDEILIADYGGGFYRLESNPAANATPDFPRKLSETGLFSDVSRMQPAAGVVRYEVNAPGWHDGATARHWFAAPAGAKFRPADNSQWQFDDGLAFVQTLSLDTSAGPRHLETRVLLKQENDWAAFTYFWNESRTDAELVPATGRKVMLELPEGPRQWLVPSRTDCLVCHSRAGNFALGFGTRQLNRPLGGPDSMNQLHWLEQQDLIRSGESALLPTPAALAPRFPVAGDTSASLEDRARAYLAVNCAHCHVNDGGGNSVMNMAPWETLAQTRLIDQVPQHGTLNLGDARIVVPGAPGRSVLIMRAALRIPGQMPPLGTLRPDPEGIRLLSEWISSLPATAP